MKYPAAALSMILTGCSVLFSLDGYEGDAGLDGRSETSGVDPRLDASTSSEAASRRDGSKDATARDSTDAAARDAPHASDAAHDGSGTSDVTVRNARLDAASSDSSVGCGSAFSMAVLGDNPIAYYPMDEVSGTILVDHGPSSRNGTYGSGVILGQPGLAPSEPETSPHFPGGHYGVSNTASVPQSAALEPGESFSVEFLFEEDAVNPGPGDADNDGFIDMVNLEWSIQLTPMNTVKFYLPLDDMGTFAYPQPSGATVLAPRKAYQVDGTYDGATVALYLDGELENTAAASGTLDFSELGSDGLTIAGTALASFRMTLKGQIAQLSLYASALTQPQIKAHYHASGLDGSAACNSDR